ncbi:N-acetyltransferase [Amycolatopsis panacis]|uniref:N-acetyltransferase n=1 Tax=Amycolatopsis panacis TaxID=2340917 RepID=A0A419HTQ5_9PSEU|nr:N-acetyltransferase [Amycolatopsis panacis]
MTGRGGLSYRDFDGVRPLDLGFRAAHWAKGDATEIGRAGLAYAFTRLAALEVVTFAEARNVRSRAVMERLGFTWQREIRYRDAPCALYERTAY